MADQKIVTETALSAFASDVKGELINKIGYDELPTIIDNEPYNFRPSGNGKGIGDRETDKIIGGSIAFNQLVRKSPEVYGASGGSTNYDLTTNTITWGCISSSARLHFFQEQDDSHTYFVKYKALSTVDGALRTEMSKGWAGATTNVTANVLTNVSAILKATTASDNLKRFQFYVNQSEYTLSITDLMVIDLTQLFGSTIADYIYSLEQGTTGAGVAYFRKLFSKPYYAYNDGELMSVKTSAHRMVGFNQWDEVWELGAIVNGANYPYNSAIRGKNYYPCISGAVYYVKTPESCTIWYYDANKTYLSSQSGRNITITAPSNAAYFRVSMSVAYGTVYHNDICINRSNSQRNGEYEPYEVNSYPLDSDLELRGIPKLDANNNLYYDGDIYESDGNVTRKYGVYVFTGEETWTKYETGGKVTFNNGGRFPSNIDTSGNGYALMSGKYPYYKAPYISAQPNKTFSLFASPTLSVCDDSFSDAAEFAASLAGIVLIYPLATPTTETADAYQNPQICDGYGTEEYVDNRAVAIPVGHETEYVKSMDRLLLPATPTADGTYTLKCTVSGGTPTLSWVADT